VESPLLLIANVYFVESYGFKSLCPQLARESFRTKLIGHNKPVKGSFGSSWGLWCRLTIIFFHKRE